MSNASGPGAGQDPYPRRVARAEDIQTPEDLTRELQTLVRASGVTRETIAKKANLSDAFVSRILHGHLPRIVLLENLLSALDVPKPEADILTAALMRFRREKHLKGDTPASGTAEAEQAARRDLAEAENELTATDELTLPALWKVTHARLDYYHQIATGQARQSFRNAQMAMGIGFVLLVVFAILALTAQSTAGAIVTGALGAVAAAFAAYIGRTFVRSQETAATHLRSYFDQPLEFSRYLAAERLLNSIERLETDQRATITAEVLRGMLPAQSSNGADKLPGEGESGGN